MSRIVDGSISFIELFATVELINQSLFAPRVVFLFFFTNKFYDISLMEQELSTNPSWLYEESPCYDTYL